jgi:hypothetical protein
MRPEWTDFEAYLAAMRSEYRSSVKKTLREVDEAGLVLERLDAAGVARHAEDIHRLYLEVHEKQKMRLVTLSPPWIPGLAAQFGDRFRTLILRPAAGGPPQGFVTLLRDRAGAIGYYIGFDKDVAGRGVPLYLRLLYALVAEAIETRAQWLSLGRTALEPKAKLGATGQELRCYVRHRAPAINAILRALLYVAPDAAGAPVRNPFKSPGRT